MTRGQMEKMLSIQAAQLAVLEGIMQNLASLVAAHGGAPSIQHWGRTEALIEQAGNVGKVSAIHAPLDFRAYAAAKPRPATRRPARAVI